MATAEEDKTTIHLEEWWKKGLVHCGGVGGGTAVVLYSQSWYAEALQNYLPLLVLGMLFWIVTIGALSWTAWEFIIPVFISARK